MAAAWKKVEDIEPVSFAEIMSEEYARALQDEEMIRNCIIPADQETCLEPFFDPVLSVEGDICKSDAAIAQMLQSEFDHDYNEELKRIERQQNKQAKVSISLSKYRRDAGMQWSEDEEYESDDYDNPKRDWDRFDTNEKAFEAIPKCGFKIDKEGEMITKHDPQICGVRNACRVMSFPPEFPTGDGAGFDMKLSNPAFNYLKSYSMHNKGKMHERRECNSRTKKGKMHDRNEGKATTERGIDYRTKYILYKLMDNQILEQINGIFSTGKESVILHASTDPKYSGDQVLPKECAVKVFSTTLNEFKQRDRYIKDDYRFKDRISKQNNRVVIGMWAEKEMHNLIRMGKQGIKCPSVVILKKHVLVMSFIGKNHCPAPKLKDAGLDLEELSVAYEQVVSIMHTLYNKANLVHADLSEYNILWMDGNCWIIDVAQSVEPGHPSALEFLMRDCDNIITFFKRKGLSNIFSKEDLFKHITTMSAETHNAAMLERIHASGAPNAVATAPNQNSFPNKVKPIPFSFDLAWEKSMLDKQNFPSPRVQDSSVSEETSTTTSGKEDHNASKPTIIETTDALQILSITIPKTNCITSNTDTCE